MQAPADDDAPHGAILAPLVVDGQPRIVQAWYPFEAPPPPTLAPASGPEPPPTASIGEQTASSGAQSDTIPMLPHRPGVPEAPDPGMSYGAVEERMRDADRVHRLPVAEKAAAPTAVAVEPPAPAEVVSEPPARYVVEGPYTLGTPDESTRPPLPRRRTYADEPASPTDGHTPQRPATDTIVSAPRDAAPQLPYGRPHASEPRPSEAAEARTVARFERLPPVDEHISPPVALADATPRQANESHYVSFGPALGSPDAPREPIPTPAASRNRDMEVIAERAGASIKRGYDLANRGALYSAEAEFTKALRTVAAALDAQEGTTRHARALAAGLAALDEAEEFFADPSGDVDVALVVARHRTSILKDAEDRGREPLTAVAAMQRYYTFAQEQLAAAVEQERVASSALYGLGKIQTTLATTKNGTLADGPRAIALHQAALAVDSRNHLAANEVGVLLARCGRFESARAALRHSVAVSPQPAAWRNLAVVHERLGESALAAEARAQAEATAKSPATSVPGLAGEPQSPVVWMNASEFAQSARPETDLQRGKATPASADAPKEAKKSGWGWPLR